MRVWIHGSSMTEDGRTGARADGRTAEGGRTEVREGGRTGTPEARGGDGPPSRTWPRAWHAAWPGARNGAWPGARNGARRGARNGARSGACNRRFGYALVRRAALVAALAGPSVVPSFHLPVLSAQSLARRLDRQLDAPPMDRNLWGVAVVDEKGGLLYGRNQRQLFIPASNTKIVVAAVASALLPPDWTVKTSLYADGPVTNGVLQGDLVLYGRGDPTFGKRCFATDTLREGACETDSYTRLRNLA
ncbi:MAG TPA: D-alanyl-D-alanine carboxypeptidase, partial [Gemmatimonadales bacterium]|nr:D-alanyl-D-alanine carboxypeptidase [Gemmatimonadales bacterium]